jgi:hypothetical protein
MTEILIAAMLIAAAYFAGNFEGTASITQQYQSACVAKYADMPHNKVEDFCRVLLKFESVK